MTFPLYHDEAERMVLGTAMRDDQYRKRAQRALTPDLFSDRHRQIWWAMEQMDARGEPVEPLMLSTRLRESGKYEEDIGKYVGDLMMFAVVGYEGFEFNVNGAETLLREAARRRRQRAIANRLLRAADENEPDESAMPEVRPLLRSPTARAAPQSLAQTSVAGLGEFERASQAHREGHAGLKYGFPKTDIVTGHQHPGDLIGLSAFTSQGKSAFALQVAHTVARQDAPALLCSNEMRNLDHFNRIVSRFSGVPHFQLRTRGADDAERARIISTMGAELSAPLYFAEGVADVETFRANLDRTSEEAGRAVAWGCLDWLQLMREPRRYESRTKELEWIVSAMKQAAIEFGIPILLVAQYNRASLGVENPMVRDTSQFEFAADVWLQLEAGDRETPPEKRREERERRGGWPVRLVGRKNRHGLGEWEEPLWFNARCARFELERESVKAVS